MRLILIRHRVWPVFLSAFFGLLAFGFDARPAGAEPRLTNSFHDWMVYVDGEGVGKICYATSKPVDMRPGRVNRGDVVLIVSNRPAESVRHEVSVRAGYSFKNTSRPYASVDGKTYQFFTGAKDGGERAHWAWVQDLDAETRLVSAMKRGNTMTIKGTSNRDTLTTDRYSLSGVTRAIASIDEACP